MNPPRRTLSPGWVGAALLTLAALGAAGSAAALEPPRDPYFQSRGTWDQDWDDQWAIKDVGLTAGPESAWRKVKPGGSEVIVALVDTGLDWNHRDISWKNIWKNPGEVPENGIDDDKNGFVDDVIGWNFFAEDNKPWDHDGHGTFIAGILAGTWNDVGIAGINPKAKLMILKALNNFGHTRASYLAHAIVYAADNGARIINLSVGGEGTTRIEQDAIDYAWKKGAIVVAASGNESVDIAEYGLAASPKVLLVGSTDFNGERAVFSNWGRNVDLAAPGLDVLSLRARRTDLMRGLPELEYQEASAYVGADKRYYRSSGTSFSAPIVAGVASLLLVNRPKLTNQQVVRILQQSARDAAVPGVDQFTGYGVVDARAALEADPAFFVDALIADVQPVQRGQGMAVQVMGTSDADRFDHARIDIGAGKTPTSWRPVAREIGKPVRDGQLGEIPAREFSGSATWQIRLTTEHKNGRSRASRFQLELE